MRHFKKALAYVRNSFNESEMNAINFSICRAMEHRCPISIDYPDIANRVQDLLEEYGEDHDLPEGWWQEEADID